MGILQAAYRTFETQIDRVGLAEENKETLTPVSHMVQNAQIEITLSVDGRFQSACTIPKEDNKTIIPATVKSASRTSGIKAHPLCDQLCYVAPYDTAKFADYTAQLFRWADSCFSHPKVRAVQRYVQGGTIVADLAAAGIIAADENGVPCSGKIEGIEYGKCMIRWRVIPAPEGISSACWQDPSLFESFADFYKQECSNMERGLCFLSGQEDILCDAHPKGVVSANFGAKLISANDSSGFTYRGRFTTASEAGSVGYTASQKAHNALRWVAANEGVTMGGRTFLCWNPEGCPVPTFALLGLPVTEAKDFTSYRQELLLALGSYRQKLPPESDIVIAALDAATTGRLSVPYYNELKGSDFLDRIEDWYTTCCWDSAAYGVQSPSLKRMVTCAFGTQQGDFIKADDSVLREHVQTMLHCIVDKQPVPQDLVASLVSRAGTPLAYNPKSREMLLATTCAVLRKYRNDRAQKEEWTLALDTENTNRSYLFGRLLAVAEHAERSTYDKSEGREPNAIRMQAVFTQRPLYAWGIISRQLLPYFAQMQPGLRAYFKNIIGEITEMMPPTDDPMLGKKLDDTYLFGYYHQRSALTRKKETLTIKEHENEYSEQ
ncbi:MAG: type I-C CRISPR-associated protein Cas8c/Csd1 [Ruthenibacterium sp.]